MSRHDDETAFRFAPEDAAPLQRGRRWGVWAAVGLFLAALLGAGAYVYRNPLSAPEWLQKAQVLPKPAPTVLYKWRDKSGAWHITDTPPPDDVAHERLEYQHDTNVLPLPPQLQPKD